MLKPILLAAAAALCVTSAMAQPTPPPKPAPVKATTATAAKKTVVTRGPAKPRTEKSLACSKQADAKNLHGKPREKFMRDCNK